MKRPGSQPGLRICNRPPVSYPVFHKTPDKRGEGGGGIQPQTDQFRPGFPQKTRLKGEGVGVFRTERPSPQSRRWSQRKPQRTPKR